MLLPHNLYSGPNKFLYPHKGHFNFKACLIVLWHPLSCVDANTMMRSQFKNKRGILFPPSRFESWPQYVNRRDLNAWAWVISKIFYIILTKFEIQDVFLENKIIYLGGTGNPARRCRLLFYLLKEKNL